MRRTKADEDSPTPQRLARDYLDAYMRGDEAAVMQRLAPDVTVYGSDEAEVVHGADGVRRLMEQDQRLWHGAARLVLSSD